MKTLKDFAKKFAVFCIIGLAVFGAYSAYTLLKKPPQLNISSEDRQYLEEIGIDVTEKASHEGLSGVHGAANGVPSLVLSEASSDSEIPAGIMGTPSETAPSFEKNNQGTPSEAIPFTASVSPVKLEEAAPFSPPAVPASITAPIGSPPAALVPAASPAAPPVSTPPLPQPPLTPSAVYSAPPLLPPVSSAPPPPKEESNVPQSPPPVSWDGAAANVYIISSSDSRETAGDVGVLSPKQEITVTKTDIPVANEKPILSKEYHFLKRLPAVEETSSKVKILSSPQPNNESVKSEVAVLEKEEPLKNESPKQEVSIKKITPVSLPQELISVPAAESAQSPYRQTSIRNSYGESGEHKDAVSVQNQAQPIVSFLPQSSVNKEVPQQTAPKKANDKDNGDVIPFSDSDAVAVTAAKEEKFFTEPNIENPPVNNSPPPIRQTIEEMVKNQEVQADSGVPDKVRDAFIQLSKLYNEHNELSSAERARMLPVLDRLALSVVYSHSTHILEPAYVVQANDTIDSIAAKIDLPAAILMKINGLTGARPLEPGMSLKTITGPFDAKLSVKRRELTLILGGLYAGRFTAALGERVEGLRGEYYVTAKENSWNERVLTLNNGVTFRGQDRHKPGDSLATVVRFTEQDAKELFDILSEHSVIVFED